MCSSCKMDPAWEKIFLTRQGAVEVEDFYKEVNYTPRKKRKSAKKYPGCPGNNGKAHVYVWTTEQNLKTFFLDYFGFHKYEKKVCVGCLHVDRTRLTEEYNKRNRKEFEKREPRRYRSIKFFSFEDYDERYREKRNNLLKRYGWTDYTYSGWWSI